MKHSVTRLYTRIKGFDYTDLRFLYIACLLSIAFVYTAFRFSQTYLRYQEREALQVIRLIENQRELAAEVERLIALARDSAAPRYQASSRQLIANYAFLMQDHQTLFKSRSEFARSCIGRPCQDLFRKPFFVTTPEELERALLESEASPAQQDHTLQSLFESMIRYHLALKDALAQAFAIIAVKDTATGMFDVIAYVTLIGLLLLQALYVFRPAIRRLNASLSTRSDFLSRISHEIRNPMNSIIGMADILKGSRLNYEQQQYVDNLLRSGHALLDMLNNLIDFSVIETGKMRLKEINFDLFRSVDRCLNLLAIPAHHKNLNVYLQADANLPNRLIGDATRLEQVLINLLNNSVKFTEQGSITVTLEILSTNEEEIEIRFAVSDSGIGIRPEQLNEIFESFVQGDSSIQRKYGGSGLGLSISREIVKLMGGKLEVQSTLGQGSTFYFTSQFKTQSARPESSISPLNRLKSHRLIMLLAREQAEIYRQALAPLFHEMTICFSAHDLRDQLERNVESTTLNQILIDDSLGIIAMINCRNLCEEFSISDRCVALLRSNFTKENMDLLKRNGFQRFLIKPLKPWELLRLPESLGETVATFITPPAPGMIVKLKEKNLRFLLVDDSNDNLFLLKELLNPFASTAHFAENGLEAIEKFRSNTYDVVFMDIQMPVMDGYTAIRKMREFEESKHKKSIPIFAVTAHAGLVDAQRCREAGFTDRIVKPVVRSDIFKSLSQSFAVENNEPETSQDLVFPAKYLAKLMPTYFKTRFEDMAKLRTAVEARDFQALKNLGHKIKGSAASYGFPRAAELSLALEKAASQSDLANCEVLVSDLEAMFREEAERHQTI